MKKYLNFLTVAIFLFIITSCASTKITSVVDPEFKKAQFSDVLVISTFSDLMYKEKIEDNFKKYGKSKNISISTGSEIMPPTRSYSNAEISNILEYNNIDCILVIALQDYWTSQTYVPKSTSTYGSASIIGNTIVYSQKKKNYGGGFISKPRVTFESRLFDAKTGNVIWRSTSLTKGNALADFSDLASSLSRTTINKLLTDRIIGFKKSIVTFDGNLMDSDKLTEKDVIDGINNARNLFSLHQYEEAISQLGLFRYKLENSSDIKNKDRYLSEIYFMWGVYYIDQKNRDDIARSNFIKVVELNPNFQIDDIKYSKGVLEIFNEIGLKINKTISDNKKAEINSDISIQNIDISSGDVIRISSKDAVLRLDPNNKSTIIRTLPIGASFIVEETIGDWIKLKLPPDKDGLVVIGYVYKSHVKK